MSFPVRYPSDWSQVPSQGGAPASGRRYPSHRWGIPLSQVRMGYPPGQGTLRQVMPRAVLLLRFPAGGLSCSYLGMTWRTLVVYGIGHILLYIYLWFLPPLLLYQHLRFCSHITKYLPMRECAKQWYVNLLHTFCNLSCQRKGTASLCRELSQ